MLNRPSTVYNDSQTINTESEQLQMRNSQPLIIVVIVVLVIVGIDPFNSLVTSLRQWLNPSPTARRTEQHPPLGAIGQH